MEGWKPKDGNSREKQHVDNLLKMKQRNQRNKFGELEKDYVEVCSIYKQKLNLTKTEEMSQLSTILP